ncbi:hypothetical protein QJQ45_021563 [Haematococcus lacustris]|nr:hypothetical protein QJQ45_021563 [Haematococcus lacustris]
MCDVARRVTHALPCPSVRAGLGQVPRLRPSPSRCSFASYLAPSPIAAQQQLRQQGAQRGSGVVASVWPFDLAWNPSTIDASVAPTLFAASLLPYLGFLYFLHSSKKTPGLTLFGFYFLLAFVGATIPAGIYAKSHYGTSLANVDWLHGCAESLLTVTNLLIGQSQGYLSIFRLPGVTWCWGSGKAFERRRLQRPEDRQSGGSRMQARATPPASKRRKWRANVGHIRIRACADYRADPKQSAPVWATLEASLMRCGRSPLKIDAPSRDRALILTHGTYTRHLSERYRRPGRLIKFRVH